MNVKDIVAGYLLSKGFDGLYNADGDSACEIGDLCPCDEPFDQCSPGYRGPDPSGEADWGMYGSKDDAAAAIARKNDIDTDDAAADAENGKDAPDAPG